MKTHKIITLEKVTTVILLSTLLVFAACITTGEKSSKEKESVSETKVKLPDMDIHTAALLGDVEAIKEHIKAGTNLNTKEATVGSSPLITAAVFNKTEVARALIEAGADVNFQNNEGSSALHTATFLCRMEIVEMLLEKDADKTLKNNYGSTAYETVAGPFSDVLGIYDIFSKDLGPFGFKLDYEYVEATRPIIAEMLR
jgi:hypothetical protein